MSEPKPETIDLLNKLGVGLNDLAHRMRAVAEAADAIDEIRDAVWKAAKDLNTLLTGDWPFEAVIIINGKQFRVNTRPLSYREVADMAGFKSPIVPSMTMRRAEGEGIIVHPSESVTPADGMVFNVADTSNA